MLFSSTFAGSSFSPERMLRSMTAPVRRFLNLVRVNAAPLPGLTNWNSMIVNGFPSISTCRPLRISLVSYMRRLLYRLTPGLSIARHGLKWYVKAHGVLLLVVLQRADLRRQGRRQ